VELAQQGFKVSLAHKDRYPSFTVGPYFSREDARDRERQVGIGLSMPLPLWNRNEGNIEAAMARQQQAETSMYVTQRTVERHVVEHALTYRTKLTEMTKWRPESVAEFRTAAELADRHYRLGAVPIATYVELQKQIPRRGRGTAGHEARSARRRATTRTAHWAGHPRGAHQPVKPKSFRNSPHP
jgi:cobalt-zinc-cadmium efflux system outer membrane protein